MALYKCPTTAVKGVEGKGMGRDVPLPSQLRGLGERRKLRHWFTLTLPYMDGQYWPQQFSNRVYQIIFVTFVIVYS